MTKKPLVSIIILNLNGYKDTKKCLTSINKTSYKNYEVILIDNGSDVNEISKLVTKKNKNLRAFRFSKNKGFTGGNNWAISKARGKYIFLLNNDTVVTPNWLGPLVDLLESDPKIAVIQPKLRGLIKKTHFDYAGAAGGFIDKYGYPFTRGRIFNTIEKDFGQYDGKYPIFWASGAACMIRKSVIKKVGGLFSENLFNYMEEIDFCWRIWRGGYKVYFTSESIVYHKGGATAGKNVVLKRFWEHRNNFYILLRNLTKQNLLKILPIRLMLEIVTYIYYFISRQGGYNKSLFLAHLDILKNGLYIRKIRNRKLLNSNLPIYPGSIVFDHYILKKKHYSNLNWSPKGNVTYIIFDTKLNTGNTVIFKQANKLVQDGYAVSIYAIRGDSQDWFDLKCNLSNVKDFFKNLVPINLVATFWPTSYLLFLLPAKNKFYFIQDWEEDFYTNKLLRAATRITYTFPFTKLVISKYLKKRIQNYDKSMLPIHHVVYATLNTDVFKFMPKKKNKKITTITSVMSWYNIHKGPDLLVKVIKKLKAKHKNLRFVLVSREKKPYSKVFDKFFTNPNPNALAKIYWQSDMLLVTSRKEGFFIPGIEAMATGTPVVSTDCMGINDYAVHNKNALIVKSLEDLWTTDIIENLSTNSNLRNGLVKSGLRVAKKFDQENISRDLKKHFILNKI